MRKKEWMAAFTIMVSLTFMASGCGNTKNPTTEEVKTESAVEESRDYQPKEVIDSTQVDKAETVYVNTDAKGKVTGIEVEAILKNPGGLEEILDTSTLADIMNKEGDEEYVQEGEILRWENHGENIKYRGTTDKEIPIEVAISYTLDGQKIEPQDLIGKSGHVVIRFDYKNRSKQKVTYNDTEYEMPVPFVCMPVLNLNDRFTEVTVSSGKVTMMDDKKLVIGLVMPGMQEALQLQDAELTKDAELKDYVEIEADVRDFELEFAETIVSNGVLSDTKDDSFDDLYDMAAQMHDLKKASGDLVNGTQGLYDGTVALQNGVGRYMNGISELNRSAGELEAGMKTLSESGTVLQSGMSAYQDAMKQYAQGIAALEGYKDVIPPEVAAAIAQLTESANSLAQSSEQLSNSVTEYTAGVTKAYEGTVGLHGGMEQAAAAGQDVTNGVTGLVNGSYSLLQGMRKVDEEGIKELEEMLGYDLEKFLDRVQALKEIDKTYQNFSGIQKNTTGSVVYIIESEGLEEK